jgi:hypothetical protein
MKSNILLLLMMCTTFISAGQMKVTVYTDDFAGAQAELGIGSYDYMTLVRSGISVVRSVRVPAGIQVTLYAEDNFRGTSLVLTQDAPMRHIEGKGFGKLAQQVSLVVAVAPSSNTPVVTIYKDNFSGVSHTLAPGYYDHFELGGVENDQLSSVKIPTGMKVTLYEHGQHGGRSLVLTEDASASFLISKKFNDLTSSIRVELIPEPTPEPAPVPVVVVQPEPTPKEEPVQKPVKDSVITKVTLYQHNYDGVLQRVNPGYYNLSELKIGNDEVSSVKVPSGAWVLLFENRDFKGRSLLLTGNASADFMAGRDFDDIASSLIVGHAKTPLPIVQLYEDKYAEPLKKFSPGDYPLLDLKGKTVSTIEIPRGLRVTLFDKPAFGGRSIELTKRVSAEFLKNRGFDKPIASLIVDQIHPHDQVVTIYQDRFSGKSQGLLPGKYYKRDLTIGDNLSSVRVPAGMRATLYEHDYFKGISVIIDRDTDYTGSKMFDNLYSSILVEDVFDPMLRGESIIITTQVVPTQPDVEEVIETPSEPERVVYSYDPPCEMTETEYSAALKAVESKPFSDEKMATARLVTKDKCLTNAQVRAIAKQFNFEEQTLEFVKYAYDLASEKPTYYQLEDVFKFMSSKEAFTTFLSTQPGDAGSWTVTTTTPVVKFIPTNGLKQEALEFSLSLISTYFAEDCEAYLNHLSDEMIFYERGGTILLNDEIKSRLCERVPRAVSDNTKSMTDYLAAYNPQVLTRAEVEAKIGKPLPDYFNTTEEEFYFLGFEPKEGIATEKFIWDEMFTFLVRKTNGKWKMKAPL